MKLIIAFIQPERLPAVKQALCERNVFKMSVTNALGCGQQKGYHESYRGVDIEVNLLKRSVSKSLSIAPTWKRPSKE